MIKIEYVKEIELRHQQYFKDYLVKKIVQVPNEYYLSSSYDNSSTTSVSFSDFKKEAKKFLSFLKCNWKNISTGKLEELKKIESTITNKYPSVKQMINSDLKLKNSILTANKDLKSTYKEYIYSIFDFKNFTTKTFYDYVKSMAISNINVPKYEPAVYKEIYEILKKNFPQQIKDIDRFFPNQNGIRESECKKRFEKLYRLDLTLLNFKGTIKGDNRNFNFNGEWNPYQLILYSGIKVCPYCNKNYVTPIFSQAGRMRADLDHFLPKSKYPYFAMSLYNLIPSCKTCNQSSKKSIDFTFDFVNPFSQSINDYFEFKANIATEELELKIIKDELNIRRYLEIFKIKSSYNYHQNQVKELVDKRLAYPEEYIKKLYEEVTYKPSDINLFKQLIIGYIDDEIQINNDVFSKLRRDLAKQLGFIGKADDVLINKLKALRK